MKKLYALVFLIINFNQILCSANNKTSGLLDISLGRVITIYKERLFVDLEIEYSGAKYVKLLRLPESVVDKTTTVDGTTNYSFKPGAMRVLLSLLIVKLNNESFLSSLNQKSPKSYFNTSDYVDEISLTGLIAKAAAEVAKAAAEAAKVAKVAKVASLETLAKELGVKESDLRSMGVSNWVRVNVLRGKPLAEDQRFLLRLQKAFIKKLRSSSIGKDNAIK